MSLLASNNRKERIQRLQADSFDVLVIGGGITGAGIALDAASRGMKVALVEMRDFASGTSSKSTKLIHGGLRYLKQLEIALVREVGSERAIVHRIAPHLVTAEKMLLPLIQGGTYGRLATSLGLMVYDFLAGVSLQDRRRMLSREETIAEEPLLRDDIITGGGLYAEYRTDDARLTIEIIKTAIAYGALPVNYVQAADFVYQNNRIKGVQCLDLLTNSHFEIRATYVVSAAGPWVDQLRQADRSQQGKRLFHSKGVHLVVPHKRLPLKNAVYFDIPNDGRMMFAIPRHRVTYLGTTDTPYDGDLNQIPITRADVEYILTATNKMFPNAQLSLSDVESSWAGLRPLIFEEGKTASEMSRKDELFESASGLISIAGGKLTGYRKMAERVVDLVAAKLSKEHSRYFQGCRTDTIALSGGPFQDAKDVNTFKQLIAERLHSLGLSNYYADYLVANYGRAATTILDSMSVQSTPEIALAQSEAQYCLDEELACKALDFFNRRSGRLYFHIQSIEPVLDSVLITFQQYLNWDASRVAQEREEVVAALREVIDFQ